MTIKLTDAAKFYKEEKHQIDAWNWLQAQVSPDVLESFASKYRTPPKPVVEVSNTWDGVVSAAKAAGAKWPECVAAQWALESGWGKHFSGTWNAFGLKGSGSTVNTQELSTVNGSRSRLASLISLTYKPVFTTSLIVGTKTTGVSKV
jgi:hypothetical protein